MKKIRIYVLIALVCFSIGRFSAADGEKPADTTGNYETIYEYVGDVNKDGEQDCVDAALVFYKMCLAYGYKDARIIYGEKDSPPTVSHLWIRVGGQDLQPFAYLDTNRYPYRIKDITAAYNELKANTFDWTGVHRRFPE